MIARRNAVTTKRRTNSTTSPTTAHTSATNVTVSRRFDEALLRYLSTQRRIEAFTNLLGRVRGSVEVIQRYEWDDLDYESVRREIKRSVAACTFAREGVPASSL
nr:MAG TPA: hypothetical protein [Caudoviricetes sp.]